jgi:hypothetical protein
LPKIFFVGLAMVSNKAKSLERPVCQRPVRLVGIVAQADVARTLPNDVVGHVLEEVSEK